MKNEPQPAPFVTVVTYGKEKRWNREEAISFFANAVLECDGSEKERYANVLAQLCLGNNYCSDE